MSAELDAVFKRLEDLPAGPWGWFGNLYGNGPYLATQRGGRIFVMQFARFGFHGAQPRFQVDHVMVDGVELARFAVGDQDVVGWKAAKANPSVYRYDITDIDHPAACAMRLIPELIAVAKAAAELRKHDGSNGNFHAIKSGDAGEALDAALAALAKGGG